MSFLGIDPVTAGLGYLTYKSYRKHRKHDGGSASSEPKGPQQGDTSYQDVDDIKRYEGADSSDFGYGRPTSTQALYKKRRPLGQ